MASTIVTTQAVKLGIKQCKNLAEFLNTDVQNLMSEINILESNQMDQNFTNFKDAVIPRKKDLENLSIAMVGLAKFLEVDLMPYIEEYIKTGKLNQDIKF